MQWLINQAYYFTGDWGIAILIISTIIRGIFIPINIKQMASTYKQQELKPKVDKIKEKYKNNKSKMNEKVMELYQEEGNPFTSCLLSLLQIPVFITIFRAINSLTINSGTILIPWVISLGNPDPLFILPIFYGIIQLLSSILRSNGNNLIQSLPLLLIVFFLWSSPVSLWIYWIVNGLFSVGEGLYFKKLNNRMSLS
ncbi:MAG: YidC/Oxa1 family membrane protein insertase [Halanaerobiales bacterium]